MTPLEKIRQQQRQELDKLIEHAGSRSALARLIGIKSPSVDSWHKRGRVSKKGAFAIERVTCGKFKKEKMRPDIDDWSTLENKPL
jgi:DNA-binding transcriptional regulator YdaS (Cro superfamily)